MKTGEFNSTETRLIHDLIKNLKSRSHKLSPIQADRLKDCVSDIIDEHARKPVEYERMRLFHKGLGCVCESFGLVLVPGDAEGEPDIENRMVIVEADLVLDGKSPWRGYFIDGIKAYDPRKRLAKESTGDTIDT